MKTIISSQHTSLSFDYENQRELMKEERFAGKQNSAGEMGHRIAKHSYDKDQAYNNGLGQLVKSTYYVLDAQGNTMATYERAVDENTLQISYAQTEKFIYGSSRLGVQNCNIGLLGSQNNAYTQTTVPHRIGKKSYELSNHLGNVLTVISDKAIPHPSVPVVTGSGGGGSTVDYWQADILQSTDYSPFGVQLNNRTLSKSGVTDFVRYGFQGQEMDDELKGEGNSYDFGARILDPRLGRWLTIDPLASLYPNESNYVFVSNSALVHKDIDGRDKVYFDSGGNETKRIKSNTVFETHVQVGETVKKVNGVYLKTPKYEQAQMPGVIKGYESAKYQKLDYQIAASTFLFNKKLASKEGLPATANHQTIESTQTPQIDVNLVKAIIMQESSMGQTGGNGTGQNDPMQSNYYGDWESSKDVKIAVGLSKNQKMDAKTSIDAGLGILYLKGIKSDANGNYTTWRGDKAAIERYNGGGTPGYADSVLKYLNSIINAKPINYIK